jgi:hypothetical protein
MDAEMGPDGALYVLEWGVQEDRFSTNNPDAKLVRIDFVGNLPPLLGDFNHDGTVGAADYTLWRNSLGQTGLASFTAADANGDGRVTAADYNIWKSHFGESLPGFNGDSGGASLAVPAAVEAPAAVTAEDMPAGAFALAVDRALAAPDRSAHAKATAARHVQVLAVSRFAARDNALAAWWESSRRTEQRRGRESSSFDSTGTDESTQSWQAALKEVFCRLADRRLV